MCVTGVYSNDNLLKITDHRFSVYPKHDGSTSKNYIYRNDSIRIRQRRFVLIVRLSKVDAVILLLGVSV